MKTFLNFNKASLPHFLSPIYIILGHCLAIFILVSPFSMFLVQLLFSHWCDWKLFVAFCSAIVFILVLFCFSSVFGCAAKLVYVRPVATAAAIHAGIQIKWPRYFSMWIFQFNVCLSGSLCKCAFMWVRCCILFFSLSSKWLAEQAFCQHNHVRIYKLYRIQNWIRRANNAKNSLDIWNNGNTSTQQLILTNTRKKNIFRIRARLASKHVIQTEKLFHRNGTESVMWSNSMRLN